MTSKRSDRTVRSGGANGAQEGHEGYARMASTAASPTPALCADPPPSFDKLRMKGEGGAGAGTESVMRVLVACEFTGTVRRAFARRGHDVWSCDLRPSVDRSNRHIVGDVRGILGDGWDLLIVAHPPCTRLCRSGRRWLSGPGDMTLPKSLPKGRTWQSMRDEFDAGVDLFVTCWRAPVERVAVENPEMHDIARRRMPADLPKPQIVQPHWFGHPEYKATGWYLRNLPALEPTDKLAEPEHGSDEWKRWNRVWRMPPGEDRGFRRSEFFPGMADALADQWGGYALGVAG